MDVASTTSRSSRRHHKHPLATRANHAAMQHPRHAHVLHVGVLGADFGRGVSLRGNFRSYDFVLSRSGLTGAVPVNVTLKGLSPTSSP